MNVDEIRFQNAKGKCSLSQCLTKKQDFMVNFLVDELILHRGHSLCLGQELHNVILTLKLCSWLSNTCTCTLNQPFITLLDPSQKYSKLIVLYRKIVET